MFWDQPITFIIEQLNGGNHILWIISILLKLYNVLVSKDIFRKMIFMQHRYCVTFCASADILKLIDQLQFWDRLDLYDIGP